jgi:type IV pilus assembly protein PilQ
MRITRGMLAGMACAACAGLAFSQDGQSDGRHRRSSREPARADSAQGEAPGELAGADALQPPASVPAADAADYTRLLEQFLKVDSENAEVYFYRCKYVAAETMRRLLENFLTPSGQVACSDEDDVVVVSDMPARLPQLKLILEQADQPVAQVLVEARIVELEISDNLTRDVNMGFAKTDSSDTVRKIFQELLLTDTADSSGTEDLTDTFSAGKGSDGHLWSFVGVDQVKIWAMINYLQEKGHARILSSPNLVIRRGASGNITTGEKVPVLSRTITGSSESISTRFENVGVKLIVTPVMIAGKLIRVKVNPEVSSSSRTVDTGGFETPVIVVRSASTELEANDNELITIGGLMRQEQRITERRVPYLADIPLLGLLFQYKQTKTFTSQIVIFMTMRLVTPGSYGAVSGAQATGVTEDLRTRVQAIEDEVIRENQSLWKELP